MVGETLSHYRVLEVALRVLAELDVAMLGNKRGVLEAVPTDNLDAYQAYLRGRHFENLPHFSVDNWNQALASYRRAVAGQARRSPAGRGSARRSRGASAPG